MVSGPLAHWEHQHIMREVAGGVELHDHITLEHKPGLMGIFTRLMFDGLPLRMFFVYRHLRTRWGIRG
jgi:ligand-binding SRPBCC domain-containing protein